jgi:hypothetical protein
VSLVTASFVAAAPLLQPTPNWLWWERANWMRHG